MNDLLADSVSMEIVKEAVISKIFPYLEDRVGGSASAVDLKQALINAIDAACPFVSHISETALVVPKKKRPTKQIETADDSVMTRVEWRRTLRQMLHDSEEAAKTIRIEYSPVKITLGHDSGVDIGALFYFTYACHLSF
jgi:hypothetical protein